MTEKEGEKFKLALLESVIVSILLSSARASEFLITFDFKNHWMEIDLHFSDC